MSPSKEILLWLINSIKRIISVQFQYQLMKRITKLLLFFGVVTLLMSYTSVSAYDLSGGYETFTGDSIPWSTYEGRFLFVEAMQVTCSWCMEQHPVLESIYTDFSSQMTMVTIAVFGDMSAVALQNWDNEYPTPWNFGAERDGDFVSDYSVTGTPAMFLFSGDGLVIKRWNGFQTYDTLKNDLTAYLAGSTPTSDTGGGGGGGDTNSGPSVIGDLLGNRVVQIGIGMSVIVGVYFYATGRKA